MSSEAVELTLGDKAFCDSVEFYVCELVFLLIVVHFEGGDSGETLKEVLEPRDVDEGRAVVETPRN